MISHRLAQIWPGAIRRKQASTTMLVYTQRTMNTEKCRFPLRASLFLFAKHLSWIIIITPNGVYKCIRFFLFVCFCLNKQLCAWETFAGMSEATQWPQWRGSHWPADGVDLVSVLFFAGAVRQAVSKSHETLSKALVDGVAPSCRGYGTWTQHWKSTHTHKSYIWKDSVIDRLFDN